MKIIRIQILMVIALLNNAISIQGMMGYRSPARFRMMGRNISQASVQKPINEPTEVVQEYYSPSVIQKRFYTEQQQFFLEKLPTQSIQQNVLVSNQLKFGTPDEFIKEFEKIIRGHKMKKWTAPNGQMFSNKWIITDADVKMAIELIDNNLIFINNAINESYRVQEHFIMRATLLDRVLGLILEGDKASKTFSDLLFELLKLTVPLIGESIQKLKTYLMGKKNVEAESSKNIEAFQEAELNQKAESNDVENIFFIFTPSENILKLIEIMEYLIAKGAVINSRNKSAYEDVYINVLMPTYRYLCSKNPEVKFGVEYELGMMKTIFKKLDPILEILMPEFKDKIHQAQQERANIEKNQEDIRYSGKSIQLMLGLPANASFTAVKSTYYLYAKENHPDTLEALVKEGKLSREDADIRIENFKAVTSAWKAYRKIQK